MTNHDADEVVGRIPVYHYRDEIPPVIVWRSEYEGEHPVKVAAVVLAHVALLLLLFVGLGMWAWIAWAAQ